MRRWSSLPLSFSAACRFSYTRFTKSASQITPGIRLSTFLFRFSSLMDCTRRKSSLLFGPPLNGTSSSSMKNGCAGNDNDSSFITCQTLCCSCIAQFTFRWLHLLRCAKLRRRQSLLEWYPIPVHWILHSSEWGISYCTTWFPSCSSHSSAWHWSSVLSDKSKDWISPSNGVSIEKWLFKCCSPLYSIWSVMLHGRWSFSLWRMDYLIRSRRCLWLMHLSFEKILYIYIHWYVVHRRLNSDRNWNEWYTVGALHVRLFILTQSFERKREPDSSKDQSTRYPRRGNTNGRLFSRSSTESP